MLINQKLTELMMLLLTFLRPWKFSLGPGMPPNLNHNQPLYDFQKPSSLYSHPSLLRLTQTCDIWFNYSSWKVSVRRTKNGSLRVPSILSITIRCQNKGAATKEWPNSLLFFSRAISKSSLSWIFLIGDHFTINRKFLIHKDLGRWYWKRSWKWRVEFN